MDDKDLKNRLEGLFSDLPAPLPADKPPQGEGEAEACDLADATPAPAPISPASYLNESGLKTLLEAMPAGIVLVDATSQLIADANAAAVRLWGGPKERLIGLVCYQVLSPSQQGHLLITANGERVLVDRTVATITLGGRMHRMEYFQTRETAQAAELPGEPGMSEQQVKAVLDAMLAGVIVIDAATHRIVEANPAAVRLWGAPKEQMLGRVCHEIVCPAQRGQCPITDGGQTVDNAERVMISAAGQRIPILKTVTSVMLHGRLHLVESLLDISSLRHSEQSLADERALLRVLIDTIPDYIYIKDTQSRMLLANVGQARLLGAPTPQDLVGKTDFDFFPRELAQKFYDDEQAIIRTGEPLVGQEEPAMDAAGHPKWTLTTKVPFRDQAGYVVGVMGIGRDITELKQARDERENLLREIRANAERQQQINTVLGRVRAAHTL